MQSIKKRTHPGSVLGEGGRKSAEKDGKRRVETEGTTGRGKEDGPQGKNPMKHPIGSDFPWDVMGRLFSHVFMVMGNEFPWEINFNHFLWEVL